MPEVHGARPNDWPPRWSASLIATDEPDPEPPDPTDDEP